MVPSGLQVPTTSTNASAMSREVETAIAPGPVVTPARKLDASEKRRDDANGRGEDAYEPQSRAAAALASKAGNTDVQAFDLQASVQRSMQYLRDVIDPDVPDGFVSNTERVAREKAKRLTSGDVPPADSNVDVTA